MEMWMDWIASGTRRQSVERGGASEYIYIECVTDVVDAGLAGDEPVRGAAVRERGQRVVCRVLHHSSRHGQGADAVAGWGGKYRGMLGTMRTVAAEEGVGALWKGVTPGIRRQVLFGGLRIGMYEPVKKFYVGEDHVGDVPLHMKLAAGLTTGGLGIMVASPTDLVKVRMQAEGKLPAGTPKKYPSAMSAYGIIVKQEGVAALWTGLTPNIMRNSIINAAELVSYDQFKETFLGIGMKDDVFTHIGSALGAGFVACLVGSPVDVVKSRVMGESAGKYKGFVDCCVKTLAHEGPMAFYGGFLPNFARLGGWNVCMFLTLEQVRKAMRENNIAAL